MDILDNKIQAINFCWDLSAHKSPKQFIPINY